MAFITHPSRAAQALVVSTSPTQRSAGPSCSLELRAHSHRPRAYRQSRPTWEELLGQR